MTLSISNTGASVQPDINSSTDATSYSNTSWTPSGDMAIVYVYSKHGTTTPNTPTIAGNSLTWDFIATSTSSVHKLSLFGAEVNGATAGVTTISFDGQTQTACIASFFTSSDVDLTFGTSSAFVQTNTMAGTGTAANNILAAAANANNRPIGGFFHWVNETATPEATYTALDALFGTATDRSLLTIYKAAAFDTTPGVTWATSATLALGVSAEIAQSVNNDPRELRRHVVKSQAVHRASRW